MRRHSDLVGDERAVSPVIATILMVAIAVVLAATVFVLVSNVADRGGRSQTGPKLQLAPGSASGNGEWVISVSASTAPREPLDAFRFSLTLPNGTQVTVPIDSNADFASGEDLRYATLHGTSAGALVTASSTAPSATTVHLRIRFMDLTRDAGWNPLDELRVGLDGSDADALYDDALARGTWSLSIVHSESQEISGEASRFLE